MVLSTMSLKTIRRCPWVSPVLVAVTLALSGCSGSTGEIERLTAENVRLKDQVQELQSKLAAATVGASTATPAANTSSSASGENQTHQETPGAKFTDINGVYGEKEIGTLVDSGVLTSADAPGGKFSPHDPASRLDFVRWVVLAHNKKEPSNPIRLAEPGTQSTFSDLNDKDPYWPYVQGMDNASYAVGYPDKTFKPNKAITREEMMAIMSPVWDPGKNGGYVIDRYEDGKHGMSQPKINPLYNAPVNVFCEYHHFERVFGSRKTIDPQQPVTRAEAAICVGAYLADK